MERNRLAEFLPRARTARMAGLFEWSPPIGAELLLAGFPAADIRRAYTYYQGGGWHGDVKLAFPLKLGGGGNRLGTPTASPCGTEAEAEEEEVAVLGALLAEADRIAGMDDEHRRLMTIMATGLVAQLTGDRATLDALSPPDEVLDRMLAGLSPDEQGSVAAAARRTPRQDAP